LQAYQWKPDGKVKALVFMSHGYAEWLLPYYNELAEEGVKAGLLMFGHDHLGHGLSPGERAQIGDVSLYVEPVIDHCRYKKKEHPGVPMFIIGHSMGGLVTVFATLQTQKERIFKGVVLTSPLIRIHPSTDNIVNRLLAKVGSKIMPSLQSGISLPEPTSDKYWLQRIRNDNVFLHRFYDGGNKALFSHSMFRATDTLRRKYSSMTTPFLMMMTVNDKHVSPKGEREFFDQASSTDKTIVYLNGGLHHFYIERQDIRNTAINKAIKWIELRI